MYHYKKWQANWLLPRRSEKASLQILLSRKRSLRQPASRLSHAEAKKDIEQLAADLTQEQEDNKVDPEKKKRTAKG